MGFERWKKMRDLLFLKLINFIDKIILEKSKIDIEATKNTPRPPKIWGKFRETLWNMMNPNKVFGAPKKIVGNLEHKD